MNPREDAADDSPLLQAADELLHEGGTGTRGWWPRAVAWLVRADLEDQIEDRLAAEGVMTDGISFRAKLLLLRHFVGEEDARDVVAAWYGLSSAGHHHAYELAPTQSELVGWLNVARRRTLVS